MMTAPRGALARRTAALLITTVAFATAQDAGAQAAGTAEKKPAAAARPSAAQSAAARRAAATKAAAPIRFTIAPTGNEARYRVREQLARLPLPNDAIGKTSELTGTILAYPDGRIVRDSSKIIVNLKSMKSDSERRDGFLQRRTLETEKFPTVELVPTSIRGFSGTLPASGSTTFELLGDLTIRGVTRPTVWKVTARADGSDAVAGTATTAFTFTEAGLEQPKVPVVLSVNDTIKLEYDFRFVRDTTKK